MRFNPHTHAGCDESDMMLSYVTSVSIHTPTQGVTLSCPQAVLLYQQFQSTHPRRV